MAHKEAEQMRTRTLITLGKPMDKDEWVICVSDDLNRFVIPCARVEWAVPCYGKELHEQEIKELIGFLQQTLEESNHEQSNLE